MSNTVFLSLGSNLGDREHYLSKAIAMISAMEGFEIIDLSSIYASPAVDMEPDSPGFLNMVIKGEFAYRPQELLTNLEEIEIKLGRTDKGHYRPRTIDIDIILFGDEIVETKQLSIPHRKMTRRPFVLAPLLQIEPDCIHPVTKEEVKTYLDEKSTEDLVIYKEFIRANV